MIHLQAFRSNGLPTNEHIITTNEYIVTTIKNLING
jgi:hypothetical protein